MLAEELFINCEKPKDWPVNARECGLENIAIFLQKFVENPSYKNKEILVAFVDSFDFNQKNMLGLYRNTDYEVALINTLYINASFMNFSALKAYLYEYVGHVGRLQKMLSNTGLDDEVIIGKYEYLLPSIKLYYVCYLDYIVNKNATFADVIVRVVNEAAQGLDEDNLIDLTHAYVSMINDLSYFECKKLNSIWDFSRKDLRKIFKLEACLNRMIENNAMERPLKGVLMTTISNYILKSRYDYNSDYIAKYISEDTAKRSFRNHEIWIRKIELLNDNREGVIIKEIFDDSSWIKHDWVRSINFERTRKYYISSFCKNYNDDEMRKKYGNCVYGFKNDRIVELIAPIRLAYNSENQVIPIFSQVLTFDVLYDLEAIKEEVNFLCEMIDLFDMNDQQKQSFLEEIMQYWIFSVKDKCWEDERERRYVIFMYEGYDYIEIDCEKEEFLKVKTSIFMMPDFLLGNNPVRQELRFLLASKRCSTVSKEHMLCENCLSIDFDSVFESSKKCSICGNEVVKITKFN